MKYNFVQMETIMVHHFIEATFVEMELTVVTSSHQS